MRLRRSNTDHTPVAATVTAFSTYLIGLCILLSLSSTRELELSPRSPQNGSLRIQDFIHRETYLRNPEASMRGMGQTDAIESVTFRHEEGNEGWKNGVKRGNRAFYGANLLKRQGDRVGPISRLSLFPISCDQTCLYQTRQAFSATMGCPALHPKAC